MLPVVVQSYAVARAKCIAVVGCACRPIPSVHLPASLLQLAVRGATLQLPLAWRPPPGRAAEPAASASWLGFIVVRSLGQHPALSMGASDDDYLPVGERPEWADVAPRALPPLPQPVACIARDPLLADLMDYFWAAVAAGEVR